MESANVTLLEEGQDGDYAGFEEWLDSLPPVSADLAPDPEGDWDDDDDDDDDLEYWGDYDDDDDFYE